MSSLVVFVHGLWMTGRESFFLCRRLTKDLGVATARFPYSSLRSGINDVTDALGEFVTAQRALYGAQRVDLVGHSLGGRVIYRAFERNTLTSADVGSVVFLGTPSVDCRCGSRLGTGRFGRALLGRAGREEFIESAPLQRWAFAPRLGIVAGNHNVGAGLLFGGMRACAGDGTVTVDETRLPGGEHLVLPVTHTGMLLSARVARAVGGFLADGRFR